MAGDWIKVEHALPDKPECIALAAKIGIDQDAVVGKLIRLWVWADQQTVDGKAKGVTSAFIDRITNCPGLAAAMVEVGWLSETSGAIRFTGFTRHNGQTAKDRAETNRRVAAHRKRGTISKDVKRAVVSRDKNTCVYCGRPAGKYTPPETKRDARMSLDHVIPVSRGGSDEVSNIVCACSKCNNEKNNRKPDECGMKWPVDENGKRLGNECVTQKPLQKPLPEKRREEKNNKEPPPAPPERPIGLLLDPEEFLAVWNANAHTRKAGPTAANIPRPDLLQARLANPVWVEDYPRALAKLPLRGHTEPTISIKWFLEENTVALILSGEWDYDAKPAQSPRGAPRRSATDDYLARKGAQ